MSKPREFWIYCGPTYADTGQSKDPAIYTENNGHESLIHVREVTPQNENVREILLAVVRNWNQLNDPHFSGPSEKLLQMARDVFKPEES